MANNTNAKCSICGNEYHMCLSCRDNINSWKIYTDTAEHYKVFQVVRGFSNNVYTKDEAREKLNNINLEDLESFRPHIKKIVKDILVKPKSVAKTIENSVDAEIIMEKTMIVENPVYSRKRSYKSNKVEV